jgi:hypothetical protein
MPDVSGRCRRRQNQQVNGNFRRSGYMERRLRVGQAITPEEFEELSDAQLARLVPKAYREYFPGKDACADGHFYLHDGTAWCFFRGDFLDG